MENNTPQSAPMAPKPVFSLRLIVLMFSTLLFVNVLFLYYFHTVEMRGIGMNGGRACTMEALLCPDGSGVGRSGANCSFSACPNQPFFVGKLYQQDGQFFLATAAPEVLEGQEVTYALPLHVKVTNVIGQLLNQQVKVVGTFREGSTLEVSSIEAVSGDTANTVQVGLGETKFVGGVKITLNKIVMDNRCPVDVVCIVAGAVTANVTLKSDTDSEIVDLKSDAPEAHPFDSFKISITAVAPSKVAASEPDPESYQVTFEVEKL
jgi:hypothetical protein